MNNIASMSVDELSALRNQIDFRLAEIAGETVTISRGRETLRKVPDFGALLHVEWAVEDQSTVEWYPTAEAAKAALALLSDSENRAPAEDGMSVDLTSPGCNGSQAWVQEVVS